MVDLSKIIGYTAKVVNSALILTPYPGNTQVSQYEQVILEIDAKGISRYRAIDVDITLPNGDIISNLHLEPLLDRPGVFQLRLNEALGNELSFGKTTVYLEFTIRTETAEYTNSSAATYNIYKTNVDISYIPDDIDTIFISLNKLGYKEAVLESELNKKLDKVSTSGELRAYTISMNGSQTLTNISNNIMGDSLVIRDAKGKFQAADPEGDYDVVNKRYLEAHGGGGTPENMVTTNTNQEITGSKTFKNTLETIDILPLANNEYIIGNDLLNFRSVFANYFVEDGKILESKYLGILTPQDDNIYLYASLKSGSKLIKATVSSETDVDTIMLRDLDGRSKVAYPEEDDDIANKGYVDFNINDIKVLIPDNASATNKLADIEFVNSSIATNTADFKGTYTSVDQLPTTNVNVNDYAFVSGTDDKGNDYYDRYKYTAENKWLFEYRLNNSSFTAEQWAAINSGITSALVDQIAVNEADIDTKLSKITTKGNNRVYGITQDGVQITYNIDNSANPDTLVYRRADGTIKVAAGDTDDSAVTLAQLNTKQDILTAGNNITITGNTISASGGSEVIIRRW